MWKSQWQFYNCQKHLHKCEIFVRINVTPPISQRAHASETKSGTAGPPEPPRFNFPRDTSMSLSLSPHRPSPLKFRKLMKIHFLSSPRRIEAPCEEGA